ncbi:amino acid adenylation domain-containing protein [Chitinivorax tropicus]|uniref:Amino acid adenylation domain-containing protein n=1 Tax=Chitinivorax tropicus TaxID=714531 RepID=A0A840MG61_9PROT|nr:amino acid adenylation domain-containing protein [Chitinivorax tropicus]MBB5018234.1 amino acid adenylation domain-containing protein [Chitinivorax tropicus]
MNDRSLGLAEYRLAEAEALLCEAGQLEAFHEWGWGKIEALPFDNVVAAIDHQIEHQAEAVALRHLDETVSYRQLGVWADRLAAHLRQLGVKPGDRVGLFVRRSIPMVAGMLGVIKTGAAYIPQDITITPTALLGHMAQVANANVVLYLSEYQHLLPVLPGVVYLAIDQFLQAPPAEIAHANPGYPAPDDCCMVLFTSGTTGTPNGVQVTHRNLCNILLTEPGRLGMQPGRVVSQLLNIAFDMAAWETLGALCHGATLLIRHRDIAEAAEQADVIIATPSILAGIDPARCKQAKFVAVAGEPCPKPLADQWAAQCSFYNCCGPTETTIVNTMQLHAPSLPVMSIGRPTPNNTVYVLNESGQPCQPGEVGEMWAGGDGITAGYLANPTLTRERYRPDPFLGGGRMMFRTRDLGRWTDGGLLEHMGRVDDQVKVRGFRVELDAVSAMLEKAPGCARAVTLKASDRDLVAFVTPLGVDPQAALQQVAAALPYYCVPTLVIPVASLPVTPRGKIDKRQLLTLAQAELAALSGNSGEEA